MLNTGKAPLNDINVRKTVIHAIDKKKIIDYNLGGIYKPVDNVFPLEAPYSDVDLTPRWDYDMEKAMFLNCPEPQDLKVETIEAEAEKSLALGLGLGLGLASLFLLVIACIYVRRSNRFETELQDMIRKAEGEQA